MILINILHSTAKILQDPREQNPKNSVESPNMQNKKNPYKEYGVDTYL